MSNQEISGGEVRCLYTYKYDFIIGIKGYFTVTAGIGARYNYGTEVIEMKGLDIRQHGSGNIGTTNVFRVCGKSLGIVVFMLDVLKGIVPVLCDKLFAEIEERKTDCTVAVR